MTAHKVVASCEIVTVTSMDTEIGKKSKIVYSIIRKGILVPPMLNLAKRTVNELFYLNHL
jgi:hypothetical protein